MVFQHLLSPSLRYPFAPSRYFLNPKVTSRISFNQRAIKDRFPKMSQTAIYKGGKLIEQIARRSIKIRSNYEKHSAPGQPPFAHDTERSPPRFKRIYSVVHRMGTRATIGMIGLFGPASTAPNLQEYGGTVHRKIRSLRKYQRRTKKGRFRTMGMKWFEFEGMVRVEPRPFMRPALAKAISSGQLPIFWRNSLGTHAVIR